MSEREARGVQELAAKNGELCFADGELRSGSVERIADEGMFESGEVHTNLMRASSVELDFDQSCRVERLKDVPIGAGGAGVCGFARGAGSHAYAALGITGDGEFDAAARRGKFSLHEREIRFLNDARAKRFGKLGVSEIVFGDENCAACVFVEAMNDARAQLVATWRERLAAPKKCVDECAAGVPRSGVNGHTGGFVDDDKVVVFVKNVERDGLGFSFEWGARFGLDGDLFATFEFLAGFGGLAVDQNESRFDEFLDPGAGEIRAVCGDETVEACASVSGRNDEFDGSR